MIDSQTYFLWVFSKKCREIFFGFSSVSLFDYLTRYCRWLYYFRLWSRIYYVAYIIDLVTFIFLQMFVPIYVLLVYSHLEQIITFEKINLPGPDAVSILHISSLYLYLITKFMTWMDFKKFWFRSRIYLMANRVYYGISSIFFDNKRWNMLQIFLRIL